MASGRILNGVIFSAINTETAIFTFDGLARLRLPPTCLVAKIWQTLGSEFSNPKCLISCKYTVSKCGSSTMFVMQVALILYLASLSRPKNSKSFLTRP